MTPGAQAVYDELSGRKGILDDINDEEITKELCEATAAAVIAAVAASRARLRTRYLDGVEIETRDA